ncbi:MAG: bifunctional folylpolyglutamate synthase/dihydrofolate synthase [Nocardioidaceae bacterium]
MPDTPELAAFRDAERALLQRWPETKLDPSLERISALCDLLGQPQRASPVVHLTGTNGKTSTARMVDTLLRGLGLRTGQFTSPHLESMTERISVDGVPLSPQRFTEVYAEVAPYAQVVDNSGAHPVSFFEFVTAMAFAAFADAPVDAAVVEVGMGGRWDSTNVADATVAVVTAIGVDHSRYLGDTAEAIAEEKAGILKRGTLGILAQQSVEVAEVLLQHAAEVGATVAREGLEFGVIERTPGIGGQMLTLQGLGATYDEIFLPLYGAHQAHNAVCALAAVEAFAGGHGLDGGLDIEVIREAFSRVTSPARLEIIRRSPTVVLDAAHNPHGAAALVEAVQESFAFSPLVGVVGVMEDKDVAGLVDAFEPIMANIVCTQNSTARAMPAEELAEVARGVFGNDRVEVAPRLDDALDVAVGLAESVDADAIGLGGGGVLVTGSVITAGEARRLLGGERR